MDSVMGELAEGNLDASNSSVEGSITGSSRVNGEVNGLSEDPLELSGEAKISALKSALSAEMQDQVSESDDDSIISSKENGSVKVPNKDSVKITISGTKVPVSVVDVNSMDINEIDSDNDDKVSIIEEKDPLELSDAHSNSISDKVHVENISDDLNSSDIVDTNGTVEDIDISNDRDDVSKSKNHKVNDKKVKENGGSDHLRSPDIEEISSDSVKFNKDSDSLDKTEDLDRDGDSRDGSIKSGETTPAKVKKSRKSIPPTNLTPRRSSRNLSRVQKSYSEPKDEPEPVEAEEESDIEEIHPVDPLADLSKPIIVKDTRKLVEIAAGARAMKGGAKKEPTLVIIDTNSILAGRGPVPMSQPQSHRLSSPLPSTSRSTQGYTILPVGLSAQGISYPKARITPYPQSYARVQPIPIHVPAPKPPPPPPQILPTLTDDMYVVEAPSFIVPYVYEKPPIKPLKDYIKKLSVEIARLTKLEEEEEKKEEEEENRKEEEKKKEDKKKDDKKKEDDEKEKEGEKINEEKTKEADKEQGSKLDENLINEDKEKLEEKDVKESVQKVKPDEEAEEAAKEKVNSEVKNGVKESDEGPAKDEAKSSSTDDEKMKIKSDDNTEKMVVDDDDEVKIITDSKTKEDTNDKLTDKPSVKEAVVEDANKDKVSTDAASLDKDKTVEEKIKTPTYFDNPLGKFFMQIGTNLVTEFVQTDLLRHQRRKRDREGKISESAQYAVNALLSNLEISKENNKPFHLPIKKCEFCSFKTESALVMAQHLETPHMRHYTYRCNFCPLEVRGPHDILFHMEAEHNVRGRLERAPAFHQCPSCPFEDNQKGKLTRHILTCSKKYKPEKNLEPPTDWEPPAKIPRVSRNRPTSMGLGTAAYQAMIAKQAIQHTLLPKLMPSQPGTSPVGAIRGRGRPTMQARFMPDMKITAQGQRPIIQASQIRPGMLYRPSASGSHAQTLPPNTYQITGNQLFQVVGSQGQMMPVGSASRLTLMPQNLSGGPTPVALVPNLATGGNSISIQGSKKNTASKLPSISITPLPRQTTITSPQTNSRQQSPQAGAQGKTYVICEICDGYIKDLEQLRNHMLWIHKVKIHPKMIHNRPPLNCQKCQCRFFTDQGLERHLLGTHGLVTSSMQEAANRGKDAGRCPACGRVYQWKLLNHVARDHGMVLKPAHLSYKCTVCTATFGMYKQFENHVYSAHSTQAKRVMDKKPPSSSQVYRPQPNEASKSLLKPLKMSDEITIIPQPSTTPYPQIGPASKTGRPPASLLKAKFHKDINCEMCEDTFGGASGYTRFVAHMRKNHLQTCVKICRIDKCPNCPKCKSKFFTESMREYLEENKKGVDIIELSDDEVAMAGQGRNEITITKVSCSPGPRRFKHRLQHSRNVQVIELEESPKKNAEEAKENGEDSLTAVKERLRRRKSLEISQVDSEDPLSEPGPSKKRRRHND